MCLSARLNSRGVYDISCSALCACRIVVQLGVRGPGLLQLGTVIEGPTEWKTARLTKKQRRSTIADELLADAGRPSISSDRLFLWPTSSELCVILFQRCPESVSYLVIALVLCRAQGVCEQQVQEYTGREEENAKVMGAVTCLYTACSVCTCDAATSSIAHCHDKHY